MARAVIFQTGFSGVDLKSNPLILGEKKKLRVATNMVFEEGVLRTRPGYRYSPLSDPGQFQGACSFKPSKGISSQSFSTHDSGIALIVSGSLWFNCRKISPKLYPCGNANLFGAENYLILQNTCSETYWWDGVTLTESPGLQEVFWQDEDTPTLQLETVAPVANPTPCDNVTTVLFTVVNHLTEARIEGATVQLKRNGNFAYFGVTNATGSVLLIPFPRTYQYFGYAEGYHTSAEKTFTLVDGVDQEIIIRLTPFSGGGGICSHTFNTSRGPEGIGIGFENTGELPITVSEVTNDSGFGFAGVGGGAPDGFDGTFPFTFQPSEGFFISWEGDTEGHGDYNYTVTSTCGGVETIDEGTI